VDNPEDLRRVLDHAGETRAQRLLREWELDGRLLSTGTEGP